MLFDGKEEYIGMHWNIMLAGTPYSYDCGAQLYLSESRRLLIVTYSVVPFSCDQWPFKIAASARWHHLKHGQA